MHGLLLLILGPQNNGAFWMEASPSSVDGPLNGFTLHFGLLRLKRHMNGEALAIGGAIKSEPLQLTVTTDSHYVIRSKPKFDRTPRSYLYMIYI